MYKKNKEFKKIKFAERNFSYLSIKKENSGMFPVVIKKIF